MQGRILHFKSVLQKSWVIVKHFMDIIWILLLSNFTLGRPKAWNAVGEVYWGMQLQWATAIATYRHWFATYRHWFATYRHWFATYRHWFATYRHWFATYRHGFATYRHLLQPTDTYCNLPTPIATYRHLLQPTDTYFNLLLKIITILVNEFGHS